MLIEEKLDEIGTRLEHLTFKSLIQLVQEAQISTTTAWSVAKNLCLLPYKIRQVEAVEEGVYERRMNFCNRTVQAVWDSVLGPRLTHLLMNLGCI